MLDTAMDCARPLASGLALTSCGPTAPQRFELVDSLGVAFAIDEDGSWSYSDDPVPVCDAGRPGWGGIYGRFVYLCSACYDDLTESYGFDPPADCRVAVCERDDECAAFDGHVYECVAGICQDPELIDPDYVARTSAEALCVATTPRGVLHDADTVDRLAALACVDDECSLPLPAGCLQPGP